MCKWFTYGPADATAASSSLVLLKSRGLAFLVPAYPGCPGKRPLNGLSVCFAVLTSHLVCVLVVFLCCFVFTFFIGCFWVGLLVPVWLPRNTPLQNDILCVERDVEFSSLSHFCCPKLFYSIADGFYSASLAGPKRKHRFGTHGKEK